NSSPKFLKKSTKFCGNEVADGRTLRSNTGDSNEHQTQKTLRPGNRHHWCVVGYRACNRASRCETWRACGAQCEERGGAATSHHEIKAHRALAEANHFAPRLTDKMMEAMMFDMQQSDRRNPKDREDSLYAPIEDGEERGGYPGHVAETSVYTKATKHPLITGSLIAGLGLAAFAAWRSVSANHSELGRSKVLLDRLR